MFALMKNFSNHFCPITLSHGVYNLDFIGKEDIMGDELIRLDTTIISIDTLINEAETTTEANALFKAEDILYSQQRYSTNEEATRKLYRAKRLLKAAMEDMKTLYKAGKDEGCYGIEFRWRFADEAEKLLKED